MLEIKCQEHLKKVRAFAESVGATEQLQNRLDYLANFGGNPDCCVCHLYFDYAPHSFQFTLERNGEPFMNGGLIYSGPGCPSDGSGPSFTVDLRQDQQEGRTHQWSVHT